MVSWTIKYQFWNKPIIKFRAIADTSTKVCFLVVHPTYGHEKGILNLMLNCVYGHFIVLINNLDMTIYLLEHPRNMDAIPRFFPRYAAGLLD